MLKGSDSLAMMEYLYKQCFELLHILADSQQREEETDSDAE